MDEIILKTLLKERQIDRNSSFVLKAEYADLQFLAKNIEKAINNTLCCTEFVCDHPENRRTYRRTSKDSYCNQCEKLVKAN